MASENAWPVVQPLPRIIVQLGLSVMFVLGHALLWNDRRVAKAVTKVEKPVGLSTYNQTITRL